MKNFFYAVLFTMIFNQAAIADDKKDAEEVLKGKLEQVISVLEKKELNEKAKKKEIIEIVTPMFNFSLMSKLTLGKKHWPGFTKDQKDKFIELFTIRLKDSYLDKMMLDTDEKIEYKESVQVGKKVQIPSILTS